MSKIVTRFAPSPTGYLHVGGVRTALFSWLWAKKNGGSFILRIEDTDLERSTQASVDVILEGMSWLGLNSDSEVVFQSQRIAHYQKIAAKLLDEGKAYRCYCSKERLESLRQSQLDNKQKPKYDGHCRDIENSDPKKPHVIRFKNPIDGCVAFHDHVYGDIEVQNTELDDLIIIRSDGMPTYNFSVVIDDADMGITDVIRGDDHINNTPRQINLYHALGYTVPRFAHLPMILGDDGKRLSKRHGAVSVLEFKDKGYLPQALLNYLVRLGWSHGDKEIFALDEMINDFSLDSVSRGTASFNYDKLDWLNQHHLKQVPVDELTILAEPFYKKKNISLKDGPSLSELLPLFIERVKTLADFPMLTDYFFIDEVTYDEAAVKKWLKPNAKVLIEEALEILGRLTTWDATSIAEAFKQVLTKLELKPGKLFPVIRVAVTGGSFSPSVDMVLALLGKDKSLIRLKKALDVCL